MSSQGQVSSVSATATIASAASTIIDATSSYSVAKSSGAATSVRHEQANVEHVWYGILGLLGLATAVNSSYLVWSIFCRYGARHVRSTASAQPSGRVALRRLPQAVLSLLRIVSFRMRIPYVDMTLLELLLAVMYVGGCLVWSFAPKDNVLPRVNLAPATWAGNTGKIAAGQLPLAVVLALKNSPITWLTGIGHERLVPVHRMVSRCIFVLVWLHLAGVYIQSPAKFINEGWKVAGLVGVVAQTITTIFGIQQIRRRYYEVFYSSHVVLILVFLIAVHIHCIPVKFDMYMWAVWAIWGFDRLVRAGRYIVFNLLLPSTSPEALVECIRAKGLRVTLKRKIPGGWKAGQHAFVAFPKLGIESHPFTILSVYDKDEGSGEAELVFIIRAMGGQTKTLLDLAMPTGSCELTALVDGPYGHPEDIRPFSTCVFIAGGTGVTYTLARMHQLFRDVLASNACTKRVVFVWAIRTEAESQWILADLAKIVALAPQSLSVSVAVFVTGVSHDRAIVHSPTLGKDCDLAKALALSTLARSDCHSSVSPRMEKEVDGCDEKTDEGFSDSQGSGMCTPTNAGTDYFDSGVSTPTFPACADTALPLSPGGITRRFGRPDVRNILEEEVTASEGAVAVDVSGPDGLVNAVRSALCQPFAGPAATLRGTPTVMLSVEQFRM